MVDVQSALDTDIAVTARVTAALMDAPAVRRQCVAGIGRKILFLLL
jgi:hypothetical protein